MESGDGAFVAAGGVQGADPVGEPRSGGVLPQLPDGVRHGGGPHLRRDGHGDAGAASVYPGGGAAGGVPEFPARPALRRRRGRRCASTCWRRSVCAAGEGEWKKPWEGQAEPASPEAF